MYVDIPISSPADNLKNVCLLQRNNFAGNKHILTKIYNLYNNIPAGNAFSVKSERLRVLTINKKVSIIKR